MQYTNGYSSYTRQEISILKFLCEVLAKDDVSLQAIEQAIAAIQQNNSYQLKTLVQNYIDVRFYDIIQHLNLQQGDINHFMGGLQSQLQVLYNQNKLYINQYPYKTQYNTIFALKVHKYGSNSLINQLVYQLETDFKFQQGYLSLFLKYQDITQLLSDYQIFIKDSINNALLQAQKECFGFQPHHIFLQSWTPQDINDWLTQTYKVQKTQFQEPLKLLLENPKEFGTQSLKAANQQVGSTYNCSVNGSVSQQQKVAETLQKLGELLVLDSFSIYVIEQIIKAIKEANASDLYYAIYYITETKEMNLKSLLLEQSQVDSNLQILNNSFSSSLLKQLQLYETITHDNSLLNNRLLGQKLFKYGGDPCVELLKYILDKPPYFENGYLQLFLQHSQLEKVFTGLQQFIRLSIAQAFHKVKQINLAIDPCTFPYSCNIQIDHYNNHLQQHYKLDINEPLKLLLGNQKEFIRVVTLAQEQNNIQIVYKQLSTYMISNKISFQQVQGIFAAIQQCEIQIIDSLSDNTLSHLYNQQQLRFLLRNPEKNLLLLMNEICKNDLFSKQLQETIKYFPNYLYKFDKDLFLKIQKFGSDDQIQQMFKVLGQKIKFIDGYLQPFLRFNEISIEQLIDPKFDKNQFIRDSINKALLIGKLHQPNFVPILFLSNDVSVAAINNFLQQNYNVECAEPLKLLLENPQEFGVKAKLPPFVANPYSYEGCEQLLLLGQLLVQESVNVLTIDDVVKIVSQDNVGLLQQVVTGIPGIQLLDLSSINMQHLEALRVLHLGIQYQIPDLQRQLNAQSKRVSLSQKDNLVIKISRYGSEELINSMYVVLEKRLDFAKGYLPLFLKYSDITDLLDPNQNKNTFIKSSITNALKTIQKDYPTFEVIEYTGLSCSPDSLNYHLNKSYHLGIADPLKLLLESPLEFGKLADPKTANAESQIQNSQVGSIQGKDVQGNSYQQGKNGNSKAVQQLGNDQLEQLIDEFVINDKQSYVIVQLKEQFRYLNLKQKEKLVKVVATKHQINELTLLIFLYFKNDDFRIIEDPLRFIGYCLNIQIYSSSYSAIDKMQNDFNANKNRLLQLLDLKVNEDFDPLLLRLFELENYQYIIKADAKTCDKKVSCLGSYEQTSFSNALKCYKTEKTEQQFKTIQFYSTKLKNSSNFRNSKEFQLFCQTANEVHYKNSPMFDSLIEQYCFDCMFLDPPLFITLIINDRIRLLYQKSAPLLHTQIRCLLLYNVQQFYDKTTKSMDLEQVDNYVKTYCFPTIQIQKSALEMLSSSLERNELVSLLTDKIDCEIPQQNQFIYQPAATSQTKDKLNMNQTQNSQSQGIVPNSSVEIPIPITIDDLLKDCTENVTILRQIIRSENISDEQYKHLAKERSVVLKFIEDQIIKDAALARFILIPQFLKNLDPLNPQFASKIVKSQFEVLNLMNIKVSTPLDKQALITQLFKQAHLFDNPLFEFYHLLFQQPIILINLIHLQQNHPVIRHLLNNPQPDQTQLQKYERYLIQLDSYESIEQFKREHKMHNFYDTLKHFLQNYSETAVCLWNSAQLFVQTAAVPAKQQAEVAFEEPEFVEGVQVLAIYFVTKDGI